MFQRRMEMNKIFVAASLIALLGLCSCEDETVQVNRIEIQSLKELYATSCSNENSGDYVYVANEDAVYTCDDGHWRSPEGDTLSLSSSSSSDTPESSSSEKKVSSSSKNSDVGTSSSEKSSSSDTPKSSSSETNVSSSEKSSSSSLASSSSAKSSSSSSVKSSSSSAKSSSSSRPLYPTKDDFLNSNISYGEYTDSRDGKTYKTTVIGYQKWLAQNLEYETETSLGYKRDSLGLYYSWEEAQTVCPAGYHLPDSAEFAELIERAMGPEHAGYTLLSKLDWQYGSDLFGFSMPKTYYFLDGDEKKPSESGASIWSAGSKISSNDGSTIGQVFYMSYSSTYISRMEYRSSSYALPVRCLNDTLQPFGYRGEYGSLTDERTGETYRTVVIGSQTWMAQDLKFPVKNRMDTVCHWHFAIDSLVEVCGYGHICGISLSAFPRQGVCPDGWHIPSKDEFQTLIDYVSENYNLVDDLRTTLKWQYFHYGTDLTGFGAYPVKGTGNFGVNAVVYWSSTESHATTAWALTIFADEVRLESDFKNYDAAIRCVKD